MSRLGDLIMLERSRQKLTRKQVAKKCGVSEGYLKDVEEGRRIIQDDQARRILMKLGTSQRNEAEFSLDEIAATVDLSTLAPAAKPAAPAPVKQPEAQPAPKAQTKEEQSGIWLDALSSVLKPVPIMNAGWIQVGRRMVPIQDGKIEGAKPDKVVYFLAPDDSMRAMRIEKGDLVLITPPRTFPLTARSCSWSTAHTAVCAASNCWAIRTSSCRAAIVSLAPSPYTSAKSSS